MKQDRKGAHTPAPAATELLALWSRLFDGARQSLLQIAWANAGMRSDAA